MKRKASSECYQQDENAVKRFRPEHKRDFFTPVHKQTIESWERLIRIASYPHRTAHHNKRMKKQRSLTIRNGRQQGKAESNVVRRPIPGGGSKAVGRPIATVSYPKLEIRPSCNASFPNWSKPTTGLKDEREQSSDSTQQSLRTTVADNWPKELKRNPNGSVLHSTSNNNSKQPSNQSARTLELSPVKKSRKVDQQQGISVQR